MFIGREEELHDLEEEWINGKFAFPVIYGRRRVGKTSLLEKFAEDKDTIFFTPSLDGKGNIEYLSELAYDAGIPVSGDSLRHVFAAIFKAAENRRLLFIIDEYPYLEIANRGASSELQRLIDKNKNSRLFLILCGSSMNFMKRQVLGYESPLFGRRTSQMMIESFTLFESLNFLKNTNLTRACELYGLVDGTPAYLERLAPEKTLRENLLEAFLKPSSYLFEENETLIKQELKQPELHNALLSIIGYKSLTPKEIVDKMERLNIDKTNCIKSIKNLEDIGILKKISAWQEPKKEIWKISDCYFSFWHTFIPKIYEAVKNRQAQDVVDLILNNYNNYMGSVFEKICVQWLKKESLAKHLSINPTAFGKWWGTDNTLKKQAEIDIVADNINGDMVFAECKWQNEPMDFNQVEKLKRRSELVKKPKNCAQAFYFFSKSGFTPSMIEKTKNMEDCFLINLEEMVEKPKKAHLVKNMPLKL